MEMKSENIDLLATALSKAQGEIEGASKDSANPFHKSKYADFHSVKQACREPLAKNQLSFVQLTDEVNGKLCLITTLMHSSGQWISSVLPVPIVKPDAQSLGSALTYCRRYGLSAMVGISTYDDDGEAATKPHREEEKEVIKAEVEKAARSPTIDDLFEALPTIGCFSEKRVIGNFVAASATKRKATEVDVIASAVRSKEQLEKFKAAFEKWQADNPL